MSKILSCFRWNICIINLLSGSFNEMFDLINRIILLSTFGYFSSTERISICFGIVNEVLFSFFSIASS